MFTPKQFGALNHFAHTQNIRNCQIRPSVTTVEGITQIGRDLFCSVASEDVKGVFHTFSIIVIGPRGGVKVLSTRHEVF